MSSILADRPAFDPFASDRLFRIATTDYGATVILPRLAALMTIEAPNASIDVVPVDGQTFRSLGEANIDIALYSDNPVFGPATSSRRASPASSAAPTQG